VTLALAYRPRDFRDLCGQPAVQRVLFMMLHEQVGEGQFRPLAEPKVPPGLLFTGTRGCGKTSTARILAAALNCQAPGERPCGSCTSCEAVRDGHHPAVTEIDAASNGTVDRIRELQELVSYDCGYPYRVVLLDEVHSMSRAGFDALLKTLEEPPPGTVFVLLTTEAGKVPATIASRCHPFSFRRIPPATIIQRLAAICVAEDIGAQPELLAHIASQADGGLRDAVMLLDQCASAGVLGMEAFRRLHGEFDFAPHLIYSMVKGDHALLFGQVDHLLGQVADFRLIQTRLVDCCCDLLRLHAGVPELVTAQGDGLERRRRLAARLSREQVVKVLRVLWDQQVHFRSADPRAALELAAVMCMEALAPGRPAAVPEAVAAPQAAPGGNGKGLAGPAELRAVLAS
jgi:DNA polymerase-3 subunit gamma/tau